MVTSSVEPTDEITQDILENGETAQPWDGA
jgi:hypothetical protein